MPFDSSAVVARCRRRAGRLRRTEAWWDRDSAKVVTRQALMLGSYGPWRAEAAVVRGIAAFSI
jgi:hypothetical protein